MVERQRTRQLEILLLPFVAILILVVAIAAEHTYLGLPGVTGAQTASPCSKTTVYTFQPYCKEPSGDVGFTVESRSVCRSLKLPLFSLGDATACTRECFDGCTGKSFKVSGFPAPECPLARQVTCYAYTCTDTPTGVVFASQKKSTCASSNVAALRDEEVCRLRFGSGYSPAIPTAARCEPQDPGVGTLTCPLPPVMCPPFPVIAKATWAFHVYNGFDNTPVSAVVHLGGVQVPTDTAGMAVIPDVSAEPLPFLVSAPGYQIITGSVPADPVGVVQVAVFPTPSTPPVIPGGPDGGTITPGIPGEDTGSTDGGVTGTGDGAGGTSSTSGGDTSGGTSTGGDTTAGPGDGATETGGDAATGTDGGTAGDTTPGADDPASSGSGGDAGGDTTSGDSTGTGGGAAGAGDTSGADAGTGAGDDSTTGTGDGVGTDGAPDVIDDVPGDMPGTGPSIIQPQPYSITFQVLDGITSDPVSGAQVQFNDQVSTTNANGQVTFTNVDPVVHIFTVALEGHETVTGVVPGDVSVVFGDVVPQPGGVPAVIPVEGDATEEVVPQPGEVPAVIPADDEAPASEEVVPSRHEEVPAVVPAGNDVSITLFENLVPSTYVIFHVYDDIDTTDLVNALVEFDDRSGVTGDVGRMFFHPVIPGTYLFKVSAQGYWPYEATLDVGSEPLVADVGLLSMQQELPSITFEFDGLVEDVVPSDARIDVRRVYSGEPVATDIVVTTTNIQGRIVYTELAALEEEATHVVFHGIIPGDYAYDIAVPGYQPVSSTFTASTEDLVVPVNLVPLTEAPAVPRRGIPPIEEQIACVEFTNTVTEVQLRRAPPGARVIRPPRGYVQVAEPFGLSCEGDSLDLTLNMPDAYGDFKVLRCDDATCSDVQESITREQLLCGNLTLSERITNSLLSERPFVSENVTAIESIQRRISGSSGLLEVGNNRVLFSNIQSGVDATIGVPDISLEQPRNPTMNLIGVPLQISAAGATSGALRVDMSYPVLEHLDTSSVVMLQWYDDSWHALPTSASGAYLSFQTDDLPGVLHEGRAVFALAGEVCNACDRARTSLAYSPVAAREAIVFVHGLLSDQSTFDPFINEVKATKQPYAVYTYGYPFNQTLDNSARQLADALERLHTPYTRITLAGHSTGGLVVQKALRHAWDEHRRDASTYAMLGTIKKAIIIAAPNKGILPNNVVTGVADILLNTQTIARFFKVDTTVYNEIAKAEPIDRIPGVDYVVIAGTQDYGIRTDVKSDGIVGLESAQTVGDRFVNDSCNDYYGLGTTHTGILDEPLSLRIIAREHARDQGDPLALGHNQYVKLNIEDCDPQSYYVVLGKPLAQKQAPQPLQCGCGNGYCGIDETSSTCPQDCALLTPQTLCSSLPVVEGMLLLLAFLLLLVGPMLHLVRGKNVDTMHTRITVILTALAAIAAAVELLSCDTIPTLSAALIALTFAALVMLKHLATRFFGAPPVKPVPSKPAPAAPLTPAPSVKNARTLDEIHKELERIGKR